MVMRVILRKDVVRHVEYFLSFKSGPKVRKELEKYLELIKDE